MCSGKALAVRGLGGLAFGGGGGWVGGGGWGGGGGGGGGWPAVGFTVSKNMRSDNGFTGASGGLASDTGVPLATVQAAGTPGNALAGINIGETAGLCAAVRPGVVVEMLEAVEQRLSSSVEGGRS